MKLLILGAAMAAMTLDGSAAVAMQDAREGGTGASSANGERAASYFHRKLDNASAYIPPQCYTKTEDGKGGVHNPCFACHTESQRPNFINDPDLQLEYAFSEDPRVNPWGNLFKDRRQAISAISDEDIVKYIRTGNYFDKAGGIALADRLKDLPADWDYNHNGEWDGFIPDVGFNFDEQGFDRDADGRYTGWRSFAYYPFVGTFWPANGSTDDVLIRLPRAMMLDAAGSFDLNVYKVNLAVVEAMIRERRVDIEPVDEAGLGGVDLDKDGKIGTASSVAYDWAPREQRFMWYVGKAHEMQQNARLHLAAGLFPEGTEFVHTVRYIDFDDRGQVRLSPRIKELRYARKRQWLSYASLRANADKEFKEKRDFPNRLRTVRGDNERGVSNGQGWTYAAFIEDAGGDLRPQTYEEMVFCVGCHGGVGATRDGIFSFGRRLGKEAFQRGWYHWSQKSLKGVADPLRADGQREYTAYLQANKAGDEFRSNTEILHRYFDPAGKPDQDRLREMQQDISRLLWPSPQRAMQLNKAYRLIVEEQSFVQGRDPVIQPLANVHRQLDEGQQTGVLTPLPAGTLVD